MNDSNKNKCFQMTWLLFLCCFGNTTSAAKLNLVKEYQFSPFEVHSVLTLDKAHKAIFGLFLDKILLIDLSTPFNISTIPIHSKLVHIESSEKHDKLYFFTEKHASLYDMTTTKLVWQKLLPSKQRPITVISHGEAITFGTDLYLLKQDKLIENNPHALQTGVTELKTKQQYATSGFYDSRIITWSSLNGELINEYLFEGWFSKKKFTNLTHAKDDSHVIATTYSGSAHIINMNKGKIEKSIKIGNDAANILGQCSGLSLVLSSGNNIKIVNCHSGEVRFNLTTNDLPTSTHYNSDHRLLTVGFESGVVERYKMGKIPKKTSSYMITPDNEVYIASTENGKTLITAANNGSIKVFAADKE